MHCHTPRTRPLIPEITLLIVIAAILPAATHAATPGIMDYQGRLTNAAGTAFPDGSYSVEFSLWNDSSSTLPANKLWSSGAVSVSVASGIFSIALGAPPMTPLTQYHFSGGQTWLGIKVATDPEVTPRTRLTSAPYALIARQADTASNAVNAPNYLPLAGGSLTGNLGVGQPTPHTASNGRVVDIKNPDGPAAVALRDGALSGAEWEIQSTVINNQGVVNFSDITDNANPVRIWKDRLITEGDGHWQQGGVDRVTISASTGTLGMLGLDGYERARLSGYSIGQLTLFDGQSPPHSTAILSANVANGGLLYLQKGSGTTSVALYGGATNGGQLDLGPGDGYMTLYLDAGGSSHGGYLSLVNGSGGIYTASLEAGGALGGALRLNDASNTSHIWLLPGQTGTNTVVLPDSAIDSREILDEPGISSNINSAQVDFASVGSMSDVVTTTLTTPSAGYVIVEAKSVGKVSTTVYGTNYGEVQIDTTAGGVTDGSGVMYGAAKVEGVWSSSYPLFLQRIYYLPVGTYTFRMEGRSSPLNTCGLYGAGCNRASVSQSSITAMYFPTSYGTVAALVSAGQLGQFAKTEAMAVASMSDTTAAAATAYRVDLRELEAKAAKARAEADLLQQQVIEEKLKLSRNIKPEPVPSKPQQ